MTTDKRKIEYKLNKQINIKLYYLQRRARWKVNMSILGYRKALLLLSCMFRRHE
jgi:hypothetical protein